MVDQRFVGTWRLVSFIFQDSDGGIRLPYGEHPSGYIFYMPDGYMAVAFMPADRSHFQGGDVMGGTPEEKSRAMETFFTYCGTFEVQGDQVVHHIEVSLFPNWSGLDQRRFYQFEGRRLTLSSPPQLFQGRERSARLVWERVAE
jgi:hypothetical protein